MCTSNTDLCHCLKMKISLSAEITCYCDIVHFPSIVIASPPQLLTGLHMYTC